MGPLRTSELELLDFLCCASAAHCRVTALKWPLPGLLSRLRRAGLVEQDSFAPTAWAFADWQAQGSGNTIETPAQPSTPEPAEPPRPEADDRRGAADVRTVAAPPIDLDKLLACFADEFETLRVIAQRFGASSPQKIVRHARTLHDRGLVEQSPPTNGQPFLLWRLAQRDTRGASGDHGDGAQRAPDVGLANGPAQQRKRRTPDTAASTHSPSVQAAQPVPCRPPADRTPRKVCQPRRDPTERPPGYGEPQRIFVSPEIGAKDRNRRAAARKLDAGEMPEQQSNVAMKITMRQVQREREEASRILDPIEQAKTMLRRRYTPVVGAEFLDPPGKKGTFLVGRRIVDQAGLLAMAKGLAA